MVNMGVIVAAVVATTVIPNVVAATEELGRYLSAILVGPHISRHLSPVSYTHLTLPTSDLV